MSEQPTNSDPAADEELVAYLDGELGAVARQQIERRLSADSDYRKRLSALQRSWDLLEVLPRAAADHQLTQTTIAMVAQDQKEKANRGGDSPARSSRTFRWRWMSLAAAAMVGFIVMSVPMRIWRNRSLRDLPIADNLELYRYAEDIQFLELLHSQGIFAEEESNDL